MPQTVIALSVHILMAPGPKGEKAPLPKILGRIVMSSAEQAFLMTAVFFGLSFAAIFLFWFAEKFNPMRGPKFRR